MREPADIIRAMNSGKTTEFWAAIKEELERRIAKLSKLVMKDPAMDRDQEMAMKLKSAAYEELINFPEELIRENQSPPPKAEKIDPSNPYD